jgi:hypothetical protein
VAGQISGQFGFCPDPIRQDLSRTSMQQASARMQDHAVDGLTHQIVGENAGIFAVGSYNAPSFD